MTATELLKAEIRRVWGRPILELALGFIVLISITTTPALFKIVTQTELQTTLNSLVTTVLYDNLTAQMLPLGLFCGILLALSFARDYEQGLMQTLLSAPVSRSSLFIVKFVAVVVPLTLLSWGVTVLVSFLNYYSGLTVLAILQFSLLAFPILFLAAMFYGGLAVLIALIIKRTIPSAVTAMIIGFLAYYITTLRVDTIGEFANYLVLTPFKAPLIATGRVLGLTFTNGTLESTLPTWNFLALSVVYALIFLIPMYIYFTRRFELRE
ncbi:MAG: ABC transporter permease [Candidatus Bathyarchaeota archaeon]|nr:ABC transporter permease [Candidatus Bathyarchaeota archaeon]